MNAPLLRALSHPAVRAALPLVAVLILGAIFNRGGAFFEWETHRAMLREISVHGILACGMTVVIITAGIDLSVGSVLALAAVSFSLFSMPLGWSAGLSIAAVLALGTLAGTVNGVLVAIPRIQAFVVTLASMVFARGLAKLLADGKKVTSSFQAADGSFVSVPQPAVFDAIDTRVFGGHVSVVTLVFLFAAVLTWLILTRLNVGRYLYAVGGSSEAARLSGVPVRATLIFAYAFAGLLSAVAGICQAAQETHGDPETGMGYELDAIAMVVLGGTSLMGGRGGMGLTLIGALTLGYLQKVLSLNAYSTEARLMLTGAIIIAAVLFQMALRSRGQTR
jgi:ribose transport system permease protein